MDLVDGKLYDGRIKLYYVENFLSFEECDLLVKMSLDGFVVSDLNDGGSGSDRRVDMKVRLSSTYHCDDDELVVSVKKRVAEMVGKSVDCIEHLQIGRYTAGQYYKAHHDSFSRAYVEKNKNQRQYTVLAYLNDDVVGGTTEFPWLHIVFRPKKGDALFWENCPDIEHYHPLSLHRGNLITSGVKYVLNVWVNFNEVKN